MALVTGSASVWLICKGFKQLLQSGSGATATHVGSVPSRYHHPPGLTLAHEDSPS